MHSFLTTGVSGLIPLKIAGMKSPFCQQQKTGNGGKTGKKLSKRERLNHAKKIIHFWLRQGAQGVTMFVRS